MATEQTPEPSNVVLQRFFESSDHLMRVINEIRLIGSLLIKSPP